MSFVQRIENAREHYVSRYRRWIGERKRAAPKAVAEVLFALNGPPSTPEKYRLYRADLVEVVGGKPEFVEMNTDPESRFKAESHSQTQTLEVRLHPFVWNGCEFRFAGSPPPWPCVDAWLEEWFDEHENKPTDNDGLAGVLHNMTQPSERSGLFSFSVDFGSAPVAAFMALLEALDKMGVRKVEVGSFHLRADQG